MASTSVVGSTTSPSAPAAPPVAPPAAPPGSGLRSIPPIPRPGVDRIANALAAAQAAVPPAPATPASAPDAAPAPAAPAGPAAVTVKPPEVPPAVAPAAEPSEPLKLSWDIVKAAEKKLMADRQQLKAEREAAKAAAAQAPQPALSIPAPGKGDPLPLLYQQGWTPDSLAQHLIDSSKGRAQPSPQTYQAAPAAPAAPAVDDALMQRLARVEGYLMTQEAKNVISDPKFKVLAGESDALDRVLNKAGQLYELTGELTLDKAAAMIQDELIAGLKARLGDAQLLQALGLKEGGAPATVAAPAATAPAADEDLNSLTNNMAVSAPPTDRRLTDVEKLQRAMTAMKSQRA